MVQIFENPNFSEDDNAAIAEKLDEELGLWIDNEVPVMEVYVEHEPGEKSLLKHRQIYAVKPGEWIDDFLSYYGAYCRLRAISEATRDKYRSEMEAFWQLAGI